jgi:hypothetical protein
MRLQSLRRILLFRPRLHEPFRAGEGCGVVASSHGLNWTLEREQGEAGARAMG